MSGLELTGIAFASASLAIQLFDGCIKGFKFFSDLQTVQSKTISLQCIIRLEEHRLRIWSERSGLTANNLHWSLDINLVNRILSQIKDLLTNTTNLESNYKISPVEHDTQNHGATTNPLDRLERIIPFNLRRTSTNLSLKQRITWVARDQSALEKLLGKLKNFIDSLHEMLDTAHQQELRDDLRFFHLRLVNLTDRVEDLHSLNSAFQSRLPVNSDPCSCAAVKALRLELTGEEQAMPLPSLPNSRRLSSVHPLSPSRPRLLQGVRALNTQRGIGVYQNIPVYIEWKHISPQDTGTRALQIDTRIACLATLMSAEKSSAFRSLVCIGYFEDTSMLRYSLMYRLPKNIEPQNCTVPSLLELFYDEQCKPSLSARIQLAYALSFTLLCLHAAGWLHKGICSDNVIVFRSTNASKIDLSNALLMGYEFARYDAPDELSEKALGDPSRDIYQHPSVNTDADSSYKKIYDIYSLGLIMIELAKWKPMKHIAKQFTDTRRCSPSDRARLHKELISVDSDVSTDIAFRAGDVYAEVVQSCLNGLRLCHDDSLDSEAIQDRFVDKVVKPLAKCVV
jgi:HET-S-like prion-inhibition and propagation protein